MNALAAIYLVTSLALLTLLVAIAGLALLKATGAEPHYTVREAGGAVAELLSGR